MTAVEFVAATVFFLCFGIAADALDHPPKAFRRWARRWRRKSPR
jgi:hypothetical protein